MARTVAAAFAAAASPELDAAIGLTWEPPPAAPVEEEVEAAFAGFDFEPFERVGRQLASRYGRSLDDAEDAVQDALLKLFATRRDLFRRSPESWVGLVYETARFRLLGLTRRRHLISIEALREQGAEALVEEARPCLALVPDGGETPRGEAPSKEEGWTPSRITGAFQRFRDYFGRPPKSKECRALHGLPSTSTVYKHFGSFPAAVLAAGMTPETPLRRRGAWQPLESAEACESFRRRNGRWPDAADVRRWPGDLPSTAAMVKYFGGTRAGEVQRGAEAILAAARRRAAAAA
jgi:DNA-directed RNA polymerase specialized sigma24 family protein